MVISKGVFEKGIGEGFPKRMGPFANAGASRMRIFPKLSEILDKAKVAELKEPEKMLLEIFHLVEAGDAKFDSGDYPEAEEVYRKAYNISIKTGDDFLQSSCLSLIGAALGMQGRDEEALPYFEQAMKLKPDIAQVWYNIGAIQGKLGQYEEALFSFEMALELEPDYAWAWVGKGAALSSLERYEEALSCFDKALALEPENVWAWRGKGVELLRFERNEEALSSLEKALELEPDDAWAWAGKGAVLLVLGRNREALPSFEKALELEPESFPAWHGKGAVLLELARYEDALSSFERALELKTDHALAWLGKGLALSKLERYEEARESSERAFSLKEKLPDKGTALFALQAQLILIQGLESIIAKDMKKAEERALELIKLRKETEQDDMAQVVGKAVAEFQVKLPKKGLKSFDEFEVMLTLLSIEDPLERWKALGKKISEKWPKGLSAVEAIRKERK